MPAGAGRSARLNLGAAAAPAVRARWCGRRRALAGGLSCLLTWATAMAAGTSAGHSGASAVLAVPAGNGPPAAAPAPWPGAAWLVSPEEAAHEQTLSGELPLTRAMPVPGAPRIELLDPESGALLRPPFEIRLRWSSPDGSALDPASLRVLYGRSRLDLTGRLLAAGTQVDPRGLSAPAQVLPAGLHRLLVEISDSQQRTGRREFVLEVADGTADGGAPLGPHGTGPTAR